MCRYELPPSQIAKPLPVTTVSKKNAAASKARNETVEKKKFLKRKRNAGQADDAPRAFKRVMALVEGKKLRSGLDDGVAPPKKKNKKAKKSKDTVALDDASEESATEAMAQAKRVDTSRALPTIRPGERFAEFAQRVDAELPLVGLVKKTVRNGKDPMGLKVWRTRKEMKMHKLYEEWRVQDAKIKERKAEEQDLAEERELEEEDKLGVSWKMADFEEDGSGGGKRRKKKAKKHVPGEVSGKEEDPWAVLNAKRGEVRTGIREVVKAPPELKIPTNKLVRGAAVKTANIPKTAGSLRQREELAGIRDDVVASYRKLMGAKRALQSNGGKPGQ